MVEGWILEQNSWPFIETAASFVDVTPDEHDKQAIEHGLSNTDFEQDHWFDYSFGSSPALSVSLALDVGTEVLFVRADADEDVTVKLGVIIDVFSNYRVVSLSHMR